MPSKRGSDHPQQITYRVVAIASGNHKIAVSPVCIFELQARVLLAEKIAEQHHNRRFAIQKYIGGQPVEVL